MAPIWHLGSPGLLCTSRARRSKACGRFQARNQAGRSAIECAGSQLGIRVDHPWRRCSPRGWRGEVSETNPTALYRRKRRVSGFDFAFNAKSFFGLLMVTFVPASLSWVSRQRLDHNTTSSMGFTMDAEFHVRIHCIDVLSRIDVGSRKQSMPKASLPQVLRR